MGKLMEAVAEAMAGTPIREALGFRPRRGTLERAVAAVADELVEAQVAALSFSSKASDPWRDGADAALARVHPGWSDVPKAGSDTTAEAGTGEKGAA